MRKDNIDIDIDPRVVAIRMADSCCWIKRGSY